MQETTGSFFWHFRIFNSDFKNGKTKLDDNSRQQLSWSNAAIYEFSTVSRSCAI